MSASDDFDPAVEAAHAAKLRAAHVSPGTHSHVLAPHRHPLFPTHHYCTVEHCGLVIPNSLLSYALSQGAILAKLQGGK